MRQWPCPSLHGIGTGRDEGTRPPPGAALWDHRCSRPPRVASNLDSTLKGQYQVTVMAQDGAAPQHTAQTVLNVSVTPIPCPRMPRTLPSPAHPRCPHADLHSGPELPHSPPVCDIGGGSAEQLGRDQSVRAGGAGAAGGLQGLRPLPVQAPSPFPPSRTLTLATKTAVYVVGIYSAEDSRAAR